MEIIKRVVNIRDFIEKVGGHEPYLPLDDEDSGATSYGKIPYNILVDEDNEWLLPFIPYYEDSGVTGIKYATLMNTYFWIKKFITNSEYYKIIKRNRALEWINILDGADFIQKVTALAQSVGVVNELPEVEEYFCNDIICVSEDAEEFNNTYSGSTDVVIGILNYAIEVINGNYNITEPFAEIPIALDCNIDDMGGVYCDPDQEWSGITYDNEAASGETFYTESQLNTLIRHKTSLDYEGNEVEFIYNSAGGYGEILYLIGIPASLSYDKKLGSYSYNYLKQVLVDGQDITAFYQTMNKQMVGKSGKIKFIYYVGNFLIDEDTDITDNSLNGLKYIDEYEYKIALSSRMGVTDDSTVPYIKIDLTTGIFPNITNFDSKKQYAEVEFKANGEEWTTIDNFIRYDELVGINEARFTNRSIAIDRGASASYEAFNIIGEVNSIKDIEKYRDDWFRIKGKND